MTKTTIKFLEKQVRYFTKRHKSAVSLKAKMDYSKRIYYWENQLRLRRKRKKVKP